MSQAEGPWLEAAFYVYPEGAATFRYKIDTNPDFHDSIDIEYQEWKKGGTGESGSWKTLAEISGLSHRIAGLLISGLNRLMEFQKEMGDADS